MKSYDLLKDLRFTIAGHLKVIYPDLALDEWVERMIDTMRLNEVCLAPQPHKNLWDQSDIAVITYGDTIQSEGQNHLKTLKQMLDLHLKGRINCVHILPFFPWSSDDGFSVINYASVNDHLGDWDDINAIARDYRLMSDLVINHCSSRSQWFENFIRDESPGKGYFYTASPDDDLSEVVRPRTNPLLQKVETRAGDQYVWCTFSYDQVDLNFENPELLMEFVGLIRFYLDQGIRIFRLDAIAFLWKQVGTRCINLPQTHEVVRLLRTLIEHSVPDAVIITETNIPNRENLSYFGNANEAHWIYNFSLPPLLLHGMLSGDSHFLNLWLMGMPPACDGTAYFNFIASHDGIGLRPAEGILSDEQIDEMADTMKSFGGLVSYRALGNGEQRPYEMNITLFDALKGTFKGEDDLGIERFVCAHAIMLALEGVPAFYIQSLFGSKNDVERYKKTNHNRHINRHQWQRKELQAAFADEDKHHLLVMNRLLNLVDIRRQQKAFHPNATQFTLHLGAEIFAFWRQSIDRRQSVFVLNNISDQVQKIPLSRINLVGTHHWFDLISEQSFDDHHDTLVLKPYQSVWLANRSA